MGDLMKEKFKILNDKYEEYELKKNELYDKINNKRLDIIKQHDEAIKLLDLKLENDIKNVKDEYKALEYKLYLEYKKYLEERDNIKKNIHKSATFDINIIGPYIAKLISVFENKNFKFEEGIVNAKDIEFYEQYLYYKDKVYMCAIITNSSLKYLNEKDIHIYKYDSIKEYLNSDDILIYFAYSKKDLVEMYDENFKYIFDNKYPYVKEFIDILIYIKYVNGFITEEQINQELNDFIIKNKEKTKKLKK